MNRKKIIVLLVLAAIALAIVYFSPGQYLNLEFIKSKLDAFIAYQSSNPIATALIFMLVYIVSTAASIPGAVFLTLLGGAIFGFSLGSALVIVSATIGATLAFLVARFLLRDWVHQKVGEARMQKVQNKFDEEGALYLFSLRLVPVFPFWMINLVMGLTPIKTLVYTLVTLIGIAPGTMVYVNAGTQLAQIDSLDGLLSGKLIFAFVLLGLFPLAAKYLLRLVKKMFSPTV